MAEQFRIMPSHQGKRYFVMRIILPTVLAFCLFSITIFGIIIPSVEKNLLDRKREMIGELTHSAWSILEEFHELERAGSLSRSAAQAEALKRIQNMRYGPDGKDYFWITDSVPVMIMHPYRPDLNGSDLSGYQDHKGKRLFVEFVKVVQASGHGYVDYLWQWKDDSTRIVPKLSYVKGFPPWNWIIGTGIYIEDVKEEIAGFTNRLIYISLGILVILAFLMTFITKQSLNIERKKILAENDLKESEAKYRALVEASTDGLIMVLDGSFVYANKSFHKMMNAGDTLLQPEELKNLLCGTGDELNSARVYFRSLINGDPQTVPAEVEITTPDGKPFKALLYASPITFGDKNGHTVIVKDIGAFIHSFDDGKNKRPGSDPLIEQLPISIFRTQPSKAGRLVLANRAARELLNIRDWETISEIDLFDRIFTPVEKQNFLNRLTESGRVINYVTPFLYRDQSVHFISVSAVVVNDAAGKPRHYEGVLEDITGQTRLNEEQENIIVSLQTSLRFLNEPVSHFLKPVVSCSMYDSVYQAAMTMSRKKSSAVLITSEKGEYIGILTDRDIRERVVAGRKDIQRPVYEVMTSPVCVIAENAMVFDAFLMMYHKSARYLAVSDPAGRITGLIGSDELHQIQRHSYAFFIREIDNAETPEDLYLAQKNFPVMAKAIIESGAQAKYTTKIITSVSDSVLKRIIRLTVQEIGEPPVRFAFMALGSQGREEQTLFSDQDNALIYEETREGEKDTVNAYFMALSERVCNRMDRCGYHFCKGNSMAKNPKWCQPLSVWKDYFKQWIYNSDPQDLLELSIFFDFRCIYGDAAFTDELRSHLFQTAENQSGFFQHLTRNSLLHKPPTGLFGKITLETKGDHPHTFNIKNALMPLSDFARIYAIRHGISETNTLDRLYQSYRKGKLAENTWHELTQTYNYLMQLRLKHQAKALSRNVIPDNSIDPNELTHIELKTLKNAFGQIVGIQKRLSYEFTGEAI